MKKEINKTIDITYVSGEYNKEVIRVRDTLLKLRRDYVQIDRNLFLNGLAADKALITNLDNWEGKARLEGIGAVENIIENEKFIEDFETRDDKVWIVHKHMVNIDGKDNSFIYYSFPLKTTESITNINTI